MKKSDYYYQQRNRQESILNQTNIFERVSGNGIWWNKKENKWETYQHILQHQDSLKNLYAPIRQKVLSYFEEYDIAWWRADEDRYFPTGNLLSSQIHCLNHLFSLRTDPYAVLSIIQNICPNVRRVLPSPIDDHEFYSKKKIKSYISFEFTYNNVDLLKERTCKRGKDCTSIDAFVYAEDINENRILIPIEWKYTEAYEKTDDKKVKEATIDERYRDLAARKDSNLGGWKDLYNWDPQYELARQTLLMEQIIDNKPFDADDYRHIVVCPNDNTEMLADAEAFKDSLKEKSKIRIIDPQELLSPLRGNEKYKDLITYLETRYWK